MPNVTSRPVPKAARKEARSTTSWSRITPTTCSQLSRHRQTPIDWARKNNHAPLVARVRHLNDKKIPDHWRAA